MKYSFEKLVTVAFNHSYFSNGVFGGLSIEPTDATSRQLLNNGLLLKMFNGGFHILYDVHFAGTERTREDVLKEPVMCDFVIRLTDNSFYNYTEPVDGDINTSIYFFHNTAADGKSLKKSLHRDKYVNAKDLLPLTELTERFFVRPFGKLELELSAALQENYTVTFKAKETYWRYILVSDDLTQLNSPAILDSVNSELFEGPETLPVRGKDTLAFRSKNPISFSQNPVHTFQLVDNYDPETGRYKVVMRALPTADPGHISRIDLNSNIRNLNYSEIFIH